VRGAGGSTGAGLQRHETVNGRTREHRLSSVSKELLTVKRSHSFVH
jgi:hypothetical protein